MTSRPNTGAAPCPSLGPSATPITTKETTKETSKETTSERTVRMQEKLLQLIRQQPENTAAALSTATDISDVGVNYHLHQL
jgi:predicted HTH transcriptional regulator